MTTDTVRGRATDSDEPREERREDAFDRIVEEGVPRLRRDWSDLLATAAVAGLEVAVGVLALLFVQHETGSELLGGLAFGFGFMALLLGHSELFTEGFLVPVTTVAAGRATWKQLVRLWGGTMVGNLVGGWVFAWIMMRALPDLQPTAIKAGSYFIDKPIGLQTFCLAVLAGSSITLMTRMQNGTDSMFGKLLASVSVGFIIAGIRLFHSILDSLVIFTALNTYHAPFGYLDWFRWFCWSVFGNIVGGVGLVTLLRLIRSRSLVVASRVAADKL